MYISATTNDAGPSVSVRMSLLNKVNKAHTDQYLNFRSHHQPSSKNSAISALFTCAERIISNTDDLENIKK